MRKQTKWDQGVFTPANRDRYRGRTPIIYRSSWEKKFMMYCDRNSNIVQWGSESQVVHYRDPTRPGGLHRYVVDFNMTARDKDGKLHKIWVEIKPASQTVQPVRGRKSERTFITESLVYAKNQAKWAAAREVASQRGARFVVLTEESLG